LWGGARIDGVTPLELVTRRVLVLVTLAAVVLKAVLLFLALPVILAGQHVNGAMFPDGYDLIAWNLASGNGYRMFEGTSLTMIRTPGYVVVLAGIFSVFGKSLLHAQVVNFVFSVITAFIVFHVSRRIMRSELVGMIAAMLVFLHPGTIVSDSRGGPESMLILLMALSLLLCEVALREHRLRYFVWLGLSFGAMMLVKSSVALILPVVAAWALFKRWRRSDCHTVASGLVLACIVSGLCMTPWVVRNFLISGEFVPTMTVGGLAAFQGQYVVMNLSSGKDHEVLLDEAAQRQIEIARDMKLRTSTEGFNFQQFYSVADELSFYSELARRTREAYVESPALLAKAVAYNLIAFWVQGRTGRVTVVNALIALPFLLLVAFGSRYALQQGHDISLLVIFTVCFILPHLFIMSMARYYIPLLPVLSPLAAVPLASVLRRVIVVPPSK
jgi:4-amino-4-deoxy-L-arabinose transferase-like glycosyltransferase